MHKILKNWSTPFYKDNINSNREAENDPEVYVKSYSSEKGVFCQRNVAKYTLILSNRSKRWWSLFLIQPSNFYKINSYKNTVWVSGRLHLKIPKRNSNSETMRRYFSPMWLRTNKHKLNIDLKKSVSIPQKHHDKKLYSLCLACTTRLWNSSIVAISNRIKNDK